MSAGADAQRIWRAGLTAVRSERLVRNQVRRENSWLVIGPTRWQLQQLRHIEVVGCGKAGAGMASGLEAALGPELLEQKNVSGWLNVPADCSDQPLASIHLHAARPAGQNEPTAEGVEGTEQMIQRIDSLGPSDLCICLISGGGSALMPAPRRDISLDDLLQVTRCLSSRGATIHQLNAVRKRLSRVQGGRLAMRCQQRSVPIVALIISDVIGDPLDVIASGPTVTQDDELAAARAALELFDHFDLASQGVSPRVRKRLADDVEHWEASETVHQKTLDGQTGEPRGVWNVIVGNNQTAVDAAVETARATGYRTVDVGSQAAEATAEEVGELLAERLGRMGRSEKTTPNPVCFVSGGEPVVHLAPENVRGRGGRNQQLVLASLAHLLEITADSSHALPEQWAILSGGTDGEDGPTDSAGAWIDVGSFQQVRGELPNIRRRLKRNDAYPFFKQLDRLLITGPTHTNVCDVRVVVAR